MSTATALPLSFHRNLYTVSPRGTRVYFALTYGQIAGLPDYAPTGAYNIEKLSATMWVVTAKVGAKVSEQTVRRVGNFNTLAAAQKAAQDDHAR